MSNFGMRKSSSGDILIPIDEAANAVLFKLQDKPIYFISEVENVSLGNGNVLTQLVGGEKDWEDNGKYYQGSEDEVRAQFEKTTKKPPFEIPENPTRFDLQKAIEGHLVNNLKLSKLSNEYSQAFTQWYNQLTKFYTNNK